jgi:hypothetical protein
MDVTVKMRSSGQREVVAACAICTLLMTTIGKGQSSSGATPLSLSASGRYLVDQKHVPYLLQGDAAWSLIVAADDQEVEQYLKDRRDKGFNALLVNLIEHLYSKKPPLNAAGDPPFLTPGDFTTPNEKYFALGDDYLAAGRTPDGSTVIAYMPTKRTITADMSKISGTEAAAWWYDLRTGKATSAGTFPTSGMQELTPPTDGDWALVLDDASRKLPPPGQH